MQGVVCSEYRPGVRLHPTPHTLHSTPFTLHPTPNTPHPTPFTLHSTPYTLHPKPHTLKRVSSAAPPSDIPQKILDRFQPAGGIASFPHARSNQKTEIGLSGDATPCNVTPVGDTTPCRITGMTLHSDSAGPDNAQSDFTFLSVYLVRARPFLQTPSTP